MKKAPCALFIVLMSSSIVARMPTIPARYKIQIIDKLIFQNDTPYEFENLQLEVQDPMAYTTTTFLQEIKIPSKKSVVAPLLIGEKQKEASKISWHFNNRILPEIMEDHSVSVLGIDSDVDYAVFEAKAKLAEQILPKGYLLEINIPEAKPVWCTKGKKRLKCKEEFVIQKDTQTPYKFIISQQKKPKTDKESK